MARSVEGSVHRSIEALLNAGQPRAAELASEIFLSEPKINEMEIVIDEHAVRMLRSGALDDADVRLVVATLRINNDLERIGDQAVNIGQRVLSLTAMERIQPPGDLAPMTAAVRAMVSKTLGALIARNVDLAAKVLESDDAVDHYRDLVCERLLQEMTKDPRQIAPDIQFVLASRHLERIADHATNIAEDILYWLRGLEVRHSRARQARPAESTLA
jgi:phosphate transport system protein